MATTAEPGDKCANPRCGHIRLVHELHDRCESLNTVTPCRCDAFVEPVPVEVSRDEVDA